MPKNEETSVEQEIATLKKKNEALIEENHHSSQKIDCMGYMIMIISCICRPNLEGSFHPQELIAS